MENTVQHAAIHGRSSDLRAAGHDPCVRRDVPDSDERRGRLQCPVSACHCQRLIQVEVVG
jgi:hypothetical protein